MKTTPATEERVWAVLSHLSAIALGMGIVLPVIGWSEQRRKSNYASFQCLQALGYQSLGYTAWLLTYLLLALVFTTALVFISSFMASNGKNADTFMGIWISIFLLIFLGTLGVYLLLPVIAAIACAPPTLNIFVMPVSLAANNIASFILFVVIGIARLYL